MSAARDPYRYFRVEARELLADLGRGVLELEKGPPGAELVGRLLRLAHTLKGAARVVRQPEIAELAHGIEDALAPLRDGRAPAGPAPTSALLRALDAIAARLAALDPAPAAAAPAEAGREPPREVPGLPPDRFESVRVDVAALDALLDDVSLVGAKLAAVQARLERGGGAPGPRRAQRATDGVRHGGGGDGGDGGAAAVAAAPAGGLRADVEACARGLATVQEALARLRLLAAGALFPAAERAARDSAQALGRRVEVQTSGADVQADAHVLASLREPVAQLVRNAVAHAIEPEPERLAAGKPVVGAVRLAVRRDGRRLVVTVEDDGRGVDVEAVRRAAVARGLLGARDALTPEGALALLLRGGLSTARTVSEVAGRGVGLDVVRDAVAGLKGELSARTSAGAGTTVELRVPVSLASVLALHVEAQGVAALLPLDGVRAAVRLTGPGAGDLGSIVHEGAAVPLVDLGDLLAPGGSPARGGRATAVVVGRPPDLAAVRVDRVTGTSQAVVRALPPRAAAAPCVAGATLDGAGDPVLVLDAAELVRAARAPRPPRAPAVPRPRPCVLVVDDSLTTRMLEQSILESAGYEVDLATSAEEALVKAHTRRYRLLVVDVEMPGMDGYELVARARDDPVLRDVPAILVTSRGSPEDRRRGLAAGARAYVVKSEFDEGRLLELVSELVT